ncbi:MAG: PQQ-binding-like beta-propeller repeat protein [Planctomycetes bacterium]|nr:PQQ-binding-like beta-propeller repeat protein [Planctomycetota bacterium]
MSIVAQCPHCETKFNLEPEMAGKKMRCPNFDCQQVFKVQASARPTEPEPSPPPPPPKPVPPPAAPRVARPTVPAKPKAPDSSVTPERPAKPRPQPPVAQPKVKEVVWSEDADLPPPPPKAKKPVRAVVDEPEDIDDRPILRRKKKKSRGPVILIGMLVVVITVAGFIGLKVLKFQGDSEEALAKQAEADYKKPDYPVAQKAFQKLAEEYPNSDNAPKYKFFADLAGLQLAVKSAANRENPEPVFDKLKQFIEANKGSEFAKHTTGYGRDIYESGKKVGEDLAAYAEERVKAKELEKVDKSVASGRELLTLVEPFKAPDDSPLDSVRKSLDQAEAGAKRERDRTAALAKASRQLETVSDAMIQMVEGELTAAGFIADPDAQAMIVAARGKLRESVKYVAEPVAPRAAPLSSAATILFVSPIGQTRRGPAAGPGDPPPSVFLAVARGILYALEEDSGALVWAVRVGTEITEPPAVARITLDDGPTDLAVVASNAGGVPALTAYVVKTGEARWYQPLEFPAAGPAAIIGTRAFVAIRDAVGTIYEYDLTTGERKGHIKLGQPVGPGAVVRGGTGLLYVAADARRVYVLDAGGKEDDGTPKPPLCVQVIATGHLPGTLRTPPSLLGPDGDEPGDRWMVLAQADGPTSTKVRAFPLVPIQTPTDGKVPAETVVSAVELSAPGWVWFPPVSDGERLALVTDTGQFRLYGVKQPNNLDKPLFALPAPTLPTPTPGTANPGLIFPAEEAAFWVLANGSMQRYRLGLHPARGVELTPVAKPHDFGIPTQPAQFNSRKTSACLVVRSANSAGCRAVLMNLSDGEIRWQRQLGVIPAAPPLIQDSGVILAAEDGGLIALPATGAAMPGRTTVAPPAWVIADSPERATGPTVVTSSADGKNIFTVTPLLELEGTKSIPKWLIRRITGGQITHRGTAVAPGGIAGQPVVLGDLLLIPATDGTVYRHVLGTGKVNPDSVVAGPPWASDRRPADAVCFLTPTSDSTFLTNDGSKKFASWSWPKGGNWSPAGKEWELGERSAGPGIVLPALPGESPRLLLADVTGSVLMFAADRPGQSVRRWRPSGGLPAGKPTSPFVVQTDTMNRLVVTYTVENKFLVCLDPEREHPRWAKKIGEEVDATLVGAPRAAGGGRWYVSDLGGRVTLLDPEGETHEVLKIGLPGVVPAVAVGSVGGGSVLVPLSDGSTVLLTFTAAPPPTPEPKGKQ